jgi:hypothetical protein
MGLLTAPVRFLIWLIITMLHGVLIVFAAVFAAVVGVLVLLTAVTVGALQYLIGNR